MVYPNWATLELRSHKSRLCAWKARQFIADSAATQSMGMSAPALVLQYQWESLHIHNLKYSQLLVKLLSPRLHGKSKALHNPVMRGTSAKWVQERDWLFCNAAWSEPKDAALLVLKTLLSLIAKALAIKETKGGSGGMCSAYIHIPTYTLYMKNMEKRILKKKLVYCVLRVIICEECNTITWISTMLRKWCSLVNLSSSCRNTTE